MTTSMLFAELVIIGIQVIVWLGLLFIGYLGIPAWIVNLKDWQTVVAVLVLCIGYTLGILFDRISDRVFARWNNILKQRIIPNPDPSIGAMRYLIAEDNDHLNNFLEYTRSRMRISRASALNFPLIAFSTLYVIHKVYSSFFILPAIVLIITLGTFLTILSLLSWHNITVTHLELISQMYNKTILKQPITAASND
ncbi:MAG: hypothetical protein AB1921_12745 [Thermodesulfobacteriota bacterium]